MTDPIQEIRDLCDQVLDLTDRLAGMRGWSRLKEIHREQLLEAHAELAPLMAEHLTEVTHRGWLFAMDETGTVVDVSRSDPNPKANSKPRRRTPEQIAEIGRVVARLDSYDLAARELQMTPKAIREVAKKGKRLGCWPIGPRKSGPRGIHAIAEAVCREGNYKAAAKSLGVNWKTIASTIYQAKMRGVWPDDIHASA